MKKILNLKYLWIALILLLLLVVYTHHARAATVNLQAMAKGNARVSQFIQFLYPKVQAVNDQVYKERKQLIALYQVHKTGTALSYQQQTWVKQLAKAYDVKSVNLKQNATWQALLDRVDIIPASMVIAQAANESAWGQSRFAKEGNNYFGQHCYRQGCGIVPRRRNPGSVMEVAKFASAKESIASYIHNLNTHGTYKKLRQIRAQMRAQGDNKLDGELNGYQLAAGLTHYSELGVYAQSIRSIIENYGLERLDNHQLA